MVNQKLRIVHAVISLDVGGLERIVLDLARSDVSAGHEVSIVCIESPGTLAGEAKDIGVDVFCLEMNANSGQKSQSSAQAILGQIRPDVFHSHQLRALYHCGPMATALKFPAIVHTEHGNHFARVNSLLGKIKLRTLWRMAGRHADVVCAVSEEIAQALRQSWTVPQRKVQVAINGIDVNRFASSHSVLQVRNSFSIPNDCTLIGTVGRLTEIKRQDRLIWATSQLRKNGLNVHLLLVGDGPSMADLKRKTQDLGINEFVHFAGYQSDPAPFLHAMDTFALTSRSEGLPVSLLEAWACGRSVLSTAVGGIPNVVADRVNGILVPEGDQEALVRSLEELVRDADLRQQLGRAGQDRVCKQFSLEMMHRNYHEIYQSVIDKKQMTDQKQLEFQR